MIVQGELRYCFECSRFPCERLRHLDKRYRTKYGMSMLENLESIRKVGVRDFVKNQRTKWTCPHCGEILCVHRPQCLSCGHRWHQAALPSFMRHASDGDRVE